MVIRGTVFLQKARLEDAEVTFRKAVEADPQSVQAVYQLARVQVLRNRRADAIASFRKLQQLDPNRQLGRLELIGLESGQDPAATGEAMVREIRDLLQKQPDQPSISGGRCWPRKMTSRGGIRAAADDGGSRLVGCGAGGLRRETEEALSCATASAVNPNDLGPTIAAQAEMAQNRWTTPRSITVILSVNRITVANLALAEIRLARGNAQDASRYAKAALQEDPKLPRASVVLGNVAVGQRRYDEAIQHFQRALEVNPREASAHLGVAHARWRKGQREPAIRAYRRAIEIVPNDLNPQNNLALLLAEERISQDEALRLAQRAWPGNPEWVIVDTLGWVYYQQEILDAEQQFRLATTCFSRGRWFRSLGWSPISRSAVEA
jgi:tetratricopeptide (TPR) repeat protein